VGSKNGGNVLNLNAARVTVGILIVGALAILAAAASAGQAAGVTTQTDSQGGVTVKVTYVTAAYFKSAPRDPLAGKVVPDRNVVFAITLDTHAGDLSGYDFIKGAILRNDRGQQVTPVQWMSTADGSHHRAGGLLFPKTDQAGRSLESQARTLELVVRGLGGVQERVLRWTLPIE
jgi:hypothetical protein